jgi:hypothetical protein
MLRSATVVFLKLLACYLCASFALLLYAMWPHVGLSETLAILGTNLWLVPAALPMVLFVPSIEGNDRFLGSLVTFLLVFAPVAYYAFVGLPWRKKTPNPAFESGPPSAAAQRER